MTQGLHHVGTFDARTIVCTPSFRFLLVFTTIELGGYTQYTGDAY